MSPAISNPDVVEAYKTLSDKNRLYTRYWAYYDGDQPLRYSTERLEELFRSLDIKFVQNWCSVVVNSAYDRIQLERMRVEGDEALSNRLMELMHNTELDIDADDITLASLVCGESYVLAWKEEDEITAYYHDPRICHVKYDDIYPRKKKWGAKWWQEDGNIRLNMYYPDRLEYWISSKAPAETKSGNDFVIMEEPAENPFEQVPIFQYRRERRKIISELNDVFSMQDMVNKLTSDLMVASEFAGLPQRWTVSDMDAGDMPNSWSDHLIIPASDTDTESTKVGQFQVANLSRFLEAIDGTVTSIGAITRTPKHYFYRQGGDPSGEALMAMEAPLVRKVQRYIHRLANTWQQVGAFLLELDGTTVDREKIQPEFETPSTVQPAANAEMRKSSADAGMPIKTILRREGWSEEQLNSMDEDKLDEMRLANRGLGENLLESQRRFDQGADG